MSERSDAPKRLAAPSDAAAPARPRRLPIPVPALALAGYVAVAFLVTAPVWGHPTMTWPGLPGDVYKFADWLAWIPHALSTHHNPFYTSAVDFPRGVNLAWETTVPLGALIVWPVTALFGPIAAYDAWFIVALSLDGWCTYLWLRRHVRHPVAAFAGGLLAALGPYMAAHSLGHLNLISFFPIPLLFIAVEKLVEGRSNPWKLGIAIGAAGAAQLYLSEELFVLAAIAVGLALLFVAVTRWRQVSARLPRAAASVAVAAATGTLIAGPMVAYQFFGPLAVRTVVQPFNTYVTDVQNLVIPTLTTWLHPGDLSATVTTMWTGNPAEQTGYIGIPLLLLAMYATVRWWRSLIVRAVAVTTAILIVLSFGPRLHIGGASTPIRLPSVLFPHVPVLGNILPGRFSLLVDLGLAFLLAIALDRTVLTSPRRAIAGSLLATVSFLAILPAIPYGYSSTVVPKYFTASGDAKKLPSGTVALVGPYIDDGTATPVVMLWQASSDFRFSLIDGLAITIDPATGRPTFALQTPLRDAFHSIQTYGVPPTESPALRQSLLGLLHQDGVSVVILGPMPHAREAESFVRWLTGGEPRRDQDVLVWDLSTA